MNADILNDLAARVEAGSTVFVIFRETGEYSDHVVSAIRFTLSEDDAKAAVATANEEGKSKAHLMPAYPPVESLYKWHMPDGKWLDGLPYYARPEGGKWMLAPDSDAIAARNAAAQAKYERECLAMGCVDPYGPANYATYSYEAVTLWTPRAAIAKENEGG